MNDLPTQPPARYESIFRLAVLFESGLMGLALVIGVLMHRSPGSWVKWNWQDAALGVMATIPMLIGLAIMRPIRRGPFGRLNAVVDNLLVPLFGGCSVVELALISLAAGVGEELLFRGALQSLLGGWLGETAGVILASVVFGLFHSITPTYAILATGIGVYLGWFTLASDNLLGPIVAHALYDFLALVFLTRKWSLSKSKPRGDLLGSDLPKT
jgi:uncharacterized protein